MITSKSNPQIKQLNQLLKKAKVRHETGLFVVEGMKMFREAPAELLVKIYVSETCYQAAPEVFDKYPHELLPDALYKSISDTAAPQGVMCLLKQPSYSLPELLEKTPAHLLFLESLQDPGNVGTIIRTAEGAGVSGVFLNKGCVDLFNPKTIRATMGSVYRMPFLMLQDFADVLDELKKREIRTFAADLHGKNTYTQENYQNSCAFFIGNEGNGLSPEMIRRVDCGVRIPMQGQVESLNAGIAAAVLMFEAARQRGLDKEN